MKGVKMLCTLAAVGVLTAGSILPARAESTSFALEPVEPSYSVTVPDQITLSRKPGETKTVTIQARAVAHLPKGQRISVTIDSIRDGAGHLAKQFYLCGRQGEGKVPLSITLAGGQKQKGSDSILGLELASFEKNGSVSYKVSLGAEADDQVDYQSTVLNYRIGLTGDQINFQ